MAIVRSCLNPRCPDKAEYRGRCKRHAREHERSINRAGKSIYNTKRWKLTRRKKLTQEPICQRSGDWHPEDRLAEHVHHIVDLDDGGAPYAFDNLEALCPGCHGKETRQRQVARSSTLDSGRGK